MTLAEVSERQKISLSYLEQLFGGLRRHGLVESVRGPGGGYNLAKPPATVSVSDIILAVDEPIDTTSCGGEKNCHDDGICLTHHLWSSLNAHIFTYLRGVSLQSLVDDARAQVAVDSCGAGSPQNDGTDVAGRAVPHLVKQANGQL